MLALITIVMVAVMVTSIISADWWYYVTSDAMPESDRVAFEFAIGAGIFIGFAEICYFYALHRTPLSIAVPITSFGVPAFTMFFGWLFLDEDLTYMHWIGMIMISFAIILMNWDQHRKKQRWINPLKMNRSSILSQSSIFLLAAVVCASVYNVFLKEAENMEAPKSEFMIAAVAQMSALITTCIIFVCLVYWRYAQPMGYISDAAGRWKEWLRRRRVFLWFGGLALVVCAGLSSGFTDLAFIFLLSGEHGAEEVGVAVPVGLSGATVVAILLGAMILGERPGRALIAGVLLAVGGVTLMLFCEQ